LVNEEGCEWHFAGLAAFGASELDLYLKYIKLRGINVQRFLDYFVVCFVRVEVVWGRWGA
jgi:hypothetical protein